LKNVSNQTVDGPSMVFLFFFFSDHGSQVGQSTVWLPIFFKISSFMLDRWKTLWNN